MEAQIASLRAELLHKEQEHEKVQLQLQKEREDRERAQRQVGLRAPEHDAGLCWRIAVTASLIQDALVAHFCVSLCTMLYSMSPVAISYYTIPDKLKRCSWA